MNLAVLGVNFRSAPVELREKASFRPEDMPAALARIRARLPGGEAVLVSTCNRTELYVAAADAVDQPALTAWLMEGAGASDLAALAPLFYMKRGVAAVEHLTAVAASLDSMVVGESEILGQVRQAYLIACREQACGTMLQGVFDAAFRIAKRVHTETDIARGRVSVSSIAVEFAEKVFEDLGTKTIMIAGAGETAELALKSLIERGVTEVLVLNRSSDRGEALASRYGGRAIQFDLLADYLPRSDIVISSTGAPHCVIRAEAVRQAIRARRGRPMLLIDIAVPRDIEAEVGGLDNVYLYQIDDLQRVADENLARRREAVDKAWAIVREGTREAAALLGGSGLQQLMKQFDARARSIKEAELARLFAKEHMAALPEACRKEIDLLAHRTINKLLAAPRETVRKAARDGQWDEYARVVNALFGFDKEEKD